MPIYCGLEAGRKRLHASQENKRRDGARRPKEGKAGERESGRVGGGRVKWGKREGEALSGGEVREAYGNNRPGRTVLHKFGQEILSDPGGPF
jgi:hypothetical protein